jgi:hypothetical protein
MRDDRDDRHHRDHPHLCYFDENDNTSLRLRAAIWILLPNVRLMN